MIIHVTAEDIKHGIRHHSQCCPVALALERDTWLRAVVNLDRIELFDWLNGHVIVKEPTRRVMKFVMDFDDGKKVKPFYFYLKEPFLAAFTSHPDYKRLCLHNT